MVKQISNAAGQTVCLGRNRPPVGTKKLHFRDYVNLSTLPTPPSSHSYAPKAYSALAEMYMNDKLGDCVIAEMLHSVGVFTGNANGGTPAKFTNSQVESLYSAIGGYVPGDPSTDNGCDEVTAMDYWKSKGAPSGQNQIAGWISVSGSHPERYTAALWLFENLMFGVELPDAWISPFPSASGFHWDVAGSPDPNNGHSFLGVAYDKNEVWINTWGMFGSLSEAAIAKYATTSGSGELYTVLSEEIIVRASAKAPSGFNFEQLLADLAAL